MEAFEITHQLVEGFPVYRVAGYFNAAAGKELSAKIDVSLDAGNLSLIIDLTPCTVLNSAGISEIMTIVMRVCDDFQGHVFLVGADQLKLSVLTLTGILDLMKVAGSLDDALRQARTLQNQQP